MKTFILQDKKTGSYFAGFMRLSSRRAPTHTMTSELSEAVTYTEDQLARLSASPSGTKFVKRMNVVPNFAMLYVLRNIVDDTFFACTRAATGANTGFWTQDVTKATTCATWTEAEALVKSSNLRLCVKLEKLKFSR